MGTTIFLFFALIINQKVTTPVFPYQQVFISTHVGKTFETCEKSDTMRFVFNKCEEKFIVDLTNDGDVIWKSKKHIVYVSNDSIKRVQKRGKTSKFYP
jgi:hypothetical protein